MLAGRRSQIYVGSDGKPAPVAGKLRGRVHMTIIDGNEAIALVAVDDRIKNDIISYGYQLIFIDVDFILSPVIIP